MLISNALLVGLWTAIQPTPITCSSSLENALSSVEYALADMEYELDGVSDRAVRKRLRRKLRDAQAAMLRAKNERCEVGEAAMMPAIPLAPGDGTVPLPPQAEVVTPPAIMASLEDKAFRSLVAAIDSEAFGDEKLSRLAAGVREVCLDVEQAKTLLELFAFSADRLRGAKVLVPRVKNRSNLIRLYEVLTFSKDKEALVELVNQVQADPGCRLP